MYQMVKSEKGAVCYPLLSRRIEYLWCINIMQSDVLST